MTDLANPQDSYKCRQALKLGIPVVSTNFISDSHEADVDIDKYVVVGETRRSKFDSGKIVGEPFTSDR